MDVGTYSDLMPAISGISGGDLLLSGSPAALAEPKVALWSLDGSVAVGSGSPAGMVRRGGRGGCSTGTTPAGAAAFHGLLALVGRRRRAQRSR